MYKKHAVYQHTLDFNPFQGINSNRINNYIFKIQNLIEEATNRFYAQNGQTNYYKYKSMYLTCYISPSIHKYQKYKTCSMPILWGPILLYFLSERK